ncbi:MAG: hypothetical protein BWX47_02111 [candidate division Hyd24-12 bacterium ADurb.Bin004]|nr:MAG: hypothetical protein BWX47_02111 [candidate division Hyd24-12 bacterium ADurb.Bin004]
MPGAVSSISPMDMKVMFPPMPPHPGMFLAYPRYSKYMSSAS